MSASRRLLTAAAAAGLALAAAAAAGEPVDHGLGRLATAAEIAGWDIDVRPDGRGLPPGSGSVDDGEDVFLEQCAFCHGDFGEGAGRYPVLMGGDGTLDSSNPVKTIGSYWPYASTVWDYVNRAMPFGNAQSLTPDQVYAVTAYLLYLNDIVDDDFVLTQANLAELEMPNRAGFIPEDPRPDVPPGEPCMSDCVAKVTIVGRAKPLDVTPEEQAPSDM
ncbi:MAG: cytochrome c [Inquilinus sp.]|nr:cytochrome c [Inquilinus sp.]